MPPRAVGSNRGLIGAPRRLQSHERGKRDERMDPILKCHPLPFAGAERASVGLIAPNFLAGLVEFHDAIVDAARHERVARPQAANMNQRRRATKTMPSVW